MKESETRLSDGVVAIKRDDDGPMSRSVNGTCAWSSQGRARFSSRAYQGAKYEWQIIDNWVRMVQLLRISASTSIARSASDSCHPR